MNSVDKYILWLTVYEGISPLKKYDLYKFFKSGENIYNCDKQDLLQTGIVSEAAAEKLLKTRDEAKLDEIISYCDKNGIGFISINDTDYPERLRCIPDPPLGLFIIGRLPKNKNMISMVGSRRCSEYGATQAFRFAKEFASKNICIVSGMADGIDAKAHLGAIGAKGKTIAVFGCGVDVVYPAVNRSLRDRIVENGCIISEYRPGAEPSKQHFPQRNRIISGLGQAVCVMEAAKKSGTLLTVAHALDQGKDVFALPGNITSKFSQGCNNLLKSGAIPLTEPEDLYEVVKPVYDDNLDEDKKNFENVETALARDEKIVYDCIGLEPITIEEIIMKTNSQFFAVNYLLVILETKGYITRLSGRKYVRSL